MEIKNVGWKIWGILAAALLMMGGAMLNTTALDVHAAVKNGWVVKDGSRYYYRNGTKVAGEWILDQNKWYYLKPETGVMAAKEFITAEDGKKYFVTQKGVRVTGWKTIKKKKYFFRKKAPVGAMHFGWVTEKTNGVKKKYYLDKNTGVMYADTMLKVSKKNYYATEDGSMKTGWKTISSKRYYFTLTGTYTGWKEIKSKWYYFMDEGYAKTGWLTYNGSKYYLSKTKGSKGVMLTGIQTISGKTYYFNDSGVMEYEMDGTSSSGAVQKPGEAHTLKNYLLGALQPVGSTLYVWGGGWAQPTATYIGVYPEWISWFNSHSGSYDFNNYSDLSAATRAKGLDCSGFVGWTTYQIMQTKSGVGSGYVAEASTIASVYAGKGYGNLRTQSKLSKNNYLGQFKAGDVGSMAGHTFIVLGQCSDGSLVIVHSTPPCVQINGTSTPSGAYDSEAITLAKQYMQQHYPALVKKFGLGCSVGTSYIRASNMLRWNTKTLSDPDGYKSKSAGQILSDLFSTGTTTPPEPTEPEPTEPEPSEPEPSEPDQTEPDQTEPGTEDPED